MEGRMKIETVGVIGMGQMGKGIAEVFSTAGYNVIAVLVCD